jgi:hypothetical protein
VIVAGAAVTVTVGVGVGGGGGGGVVIVTAAVLLLDRSCVDVAVIVTVPAAALVNRPVELIAPAVAGETVQVTAVLNAPVPSTTAEHCDVCPVWIEGGAQVSVMLVMVGVCALPLLPPLLGAVAARAPPHAAQASNRKMDTTAATPVRVWEGLIRAILTSSIYEERAPSTSQ